MASNALARDVLWEAASGQHGYVTASQAEGLGVTRRALNQLAVRGTLEHASYGVYRFVKYPFDQADPYMRAVLWTGAREAALSHETALDLFEVSDINPGHIHMTVGVQRRIRRSGGVQYVVHRQDLHSEQITWWREVPIVKLATAIHQCVRFGTPTYLLSQAISNGHRHGRLTTSQRDELTALIDAGSAATTEGRI
ncbi:type IV toxin-antitoxin system AbiEi family antitoxin domain-containing protein [Microbacterium sp. ASV81]|uniref:AbiEi antitoxin N-terminal domain-containing protein n=1 Tax=Microbacterium capsulatum TaxID=3041921 RepID=A0ABU0XIV6_9MICO|nr:type IV toxin-antitoxin system AbiEi family antitoxin domain-containing protein [Microbacterium sp. ASV81]MDQ4215057.1 hypothetical protein [Microbacterium sp. ASV81]